MNSRLSQAEMVETLVDRSKKLLDAKSPKDAMRGRLLAEIANLLDSAQVRPITPSEWEDHELRWQEHAADLRRALVDSMAHLMLGIEALARAEPGRITAELAELLVWWQGENGREQTLSELPLERRKELEAEAATYPRKREDQT